MFLQTKHTKQTLKLLTRLKPLWPNSHIQLCKPKHDVLLERCYCRPLQRSLTCLMLSSASPMLRKQEGDWGFVSDLRNCFKQSLGSRINCFGNDKKKMKKIMMVKRKGHCGSQFELLVCLRKNKLMPMDLCGKMSKTTASCLKDMGHIHVILTLWNLSLLKKYSTWLMLGLLLVQMFLLLDRI